MRYSVIVLVVFVAFFTYVCAQEKVVPNLAVKRYMHLRKWVQRAMKNDMPVAGRLQTWKHRTSCLKDDELMLPERLLDWFHVLKSIDTKRSGKKLDMGSANTGCTSPAIVWFFKQFDQNKDSLLDKTELSELETIPYEHCMRKFLGKCDKNKDHKLDLQETCSCFNVEPPCSQKLKEYYAKGPMLGGFKPECDEDGFYKPRQCMEAHCWCVDRFNTRIEGSENFAWRTSCRDNTDPNDELFAGSEEAEQQGAGI